MISKKALKEFKEIYKKEFNIELSDQDALEKAIKLLNLMKAVYKPMLKDDYEKIQKKENKQKNRKLKNNKDWKERQGLLGFFDLLFKIDKRINPLSYKNDN